MTKKQEINNEDLKVLDSKQAVTDFTKLINSNTFISQIHEYKRRVDRIEEETRNNYLIPWNLKEKVFLEEVEKVESAMREVAEAETAEAKELKQGIEEFVDSQIKAEKELKGKGLQKYKEIDTQYNSAVRSQLLFFTDTKNVENYFNALLREFEGDNLKLRWLKDNAHLFLSRQESLGGTTKTLYTLYQKAENKSQSHREKTLKKVREYIDTIYPNDIPLNNIMKKYKQYKLKSLSGLVGQVKEQEKLEQEKERIRQNFRLPESAERYKII